MNDFAARETDYFDGIIAESGNEQAIAGRIVCEMIKPPLDAGKWDGTFQREAPRNEPDHECERDEGKENE